MIPSSMKSTFDATWRAKPISWVTTTIVIPSSASFFITCKTSPTISGSSAEVGSYDFVDRVLDTAAKEGAVHLPEDEISSPTSAEALAGFIDCLMHSREYGLFHASCDGSCSRAEYAREILRLAGKENVPVTSASENTALRPRFTLLDNMMLRITGLYQMPDWHDALSEYMSHRQTGVNK